MDPQLEGVTLAQRLAAGPIEPRKALDIVEQLLSGLVVAHDSGLIHGSISPQKVILTPDGRATLVGFPGRDAAAQPLARFAAGAAEPAYVSPEQIVDDPVGRRTDIYSLGVLAYTMLVGKDPFGAAEGVASDNVFYRILYKPVPQVPAAALTGLPSTVGPAIEKAMAKEPQGRFLDAGSFLQALRVKADVVAAPLPLDPKQVKKEEERRRREEEKLAAQKAELLAINEKALERQKAAALKEEERRRKADEKGNKKAAAIWASADAGDAEAAAAAAAVAAGKPLKGNRKDDRGDGRNLKPFLLIAGVIVILLIVGVGAAYATGAIGGGSPDTTVASVEDTTTTGRPATTLEQTTTTEEPTTTSETETSTTTTLAVDTTTTLLPTTTLSTVLSTTTTAKPTTTTQKPTTTTALKTATITVTDASATYNGSAQHPSVTTSPSGLAVKYSSQPTNAGTYTITITVTSAGYKGSTSTSFTINKADATISVSGWSGTFDGDSHGAHVNYATGVKGESLAGSVDLGSRFTDPGEHYATWSFSNANYKSESRSVLISIDPAP